MAALYPNELVYSTIQPWVIVFKENFENITSCIAKWNIVDDFTSIFLNCGELSFNIVAWWGLVSDMPPGGRLNKKDGLTRYGDSHVKDKTS